MLPPGLKHVLLAISPSIFPRQERHSLTSTATYHFRQIPYTYTVHAMHKKKKSQPLKTLGTQIRYTLFSSALVVDLHVLVVLFTTLIFLTAVRTNLFRGGGGTHGRPQGTELGWRNETKQNKTKAAVKILPQRSVDRVAGAQRSLVGSSGGADRTPPTFWMWSPR